jgi:transposase
MTSARPHVTGGVDTHADVHVAALLDSATGRLLSTASFDTTKKGYRSLIAWMTAAGELDLVGVESTGSYGAGLTRAMNDAAVRVVEVDRPDRKARRHHGKSDTVDAIAAARAALSGVACGEPKRRDGDIEVIRQHEIVRSSAVQARTAAINAFGALVITAPNGLRDQLRRHDSDTQHQHARAWRQHPSDDAATRSCRHVLARLARRIAALDAEITEADAELAALTAAAAPALVGLFGVGPTVAAQLLTAAGDNPQRLRSEAAFAKLAGACPVTASSGKTNRHRLNRSGDRDANNALYRIAIVRMRYHQPTRDYVRRRTTEGKTKPEIIRCLKRYIAREVFTAIVHPPSDIPTGHDLRQTRLQARLPLVAVASAHRIAPIELSRLERGLHHNTDLARRIHAWLDNHLQQTAWHL